MPEIYQFKIFKADVEKNSDTGLTVRLFYPQNPEPLEKRLEQNLEFGIKVFEQLKENGRAEIANATHPIGPAAAGSLILSADSKIICHRRDSGASTHPMYHSAYAGHADSKEATSTAERLRSVGLRESSEECLLITKDKNPWLIVPNDSREFTIQSANRLGLDFQDRYRFVNVEILEPQDKLKVYNSNNNLLFSTSTNLDFIFESQTSLNCLWIRRFPLASDEVLPIDGEGMHKDKRYTHFNRESYLIDPSEIANKPFGHVLQNPKVFQTRIHNNAPEVFTPTYTKPYLGPDKIQVTNPHIWAPENLLTRSLNALNIPGYDWMQMELWKEKSKLEGKSLLPKKVLA